MIKRDYYNKLRSLDSNIRIKVETICPQCRKIHIVEVKSKDYYEYKLGKHIQEAFSYLSTDEREMLLTGLCKECWDKLFEE